MRVLTGEINTNEKKNIILTHDDADGLMSAAVFQKLMKADDGVWGVISSINPTSAETDRMFEEAKKRWQISKGVKVIVIDREILSEKVLESLKDNCVIYIDHHKTSENSSFDKNVTFIWDEKESAATLSLRYFEKFPEDWKKVSEREMGIIKRVAENVKLWDTFQWTQLDISKDSDRAKYEGAFGINAAEKIFGKKYLYKLFMEDMERPEIIEKRCLMAYEIYMNEYEEYKLNGNPYSKDISHMGAKIRIYCGFDSRFQSLYSREIFQKGELDVVIYANLDGTASIRNREGTDSVYLASELGRLNGFSGGGHKTATGCRIADFNEVREKIVDRVIKSIEKIGDLKL